LIVIEGPITADCFGPLVVVEGAAFEIVAAGVAGVGATGAGLELRMGSPCVRTVPGSSLRLFHTSIPSFG
jgi:hypothetical protein